MANKRKEKTKSIPFLTIAMICCRKFSHIYRKVLLKLIFASLFAFFFRYSFFCTKDNKSAAWKIKEKRKMKIEKSCLSLLEYRLWFLFNLPATQWNRQMYRVTWAINHLTAQAEMKNILKWKSISRNSLLTNKQLLYKLEIHLVQKN